MAKFSKSLDQYIKKNKKKNESVNDFFIRVVEKDSKSFLNIILGDLRTSASNLVAIFDTFKSEEDALDWYYAEKGYLKQYNNYFYKKFDKAKKPEDIIKYLPNIAPWTYNRSFDTTEMGVIPDSFIDKKILIKLVNKILSSKEIRKFKRMKDREHKDHPWFKKVNNKKLISFWDIDNFWKKVNEAKTEKISIVKIKNHKYGVIPLYNPYTAKMVVKVKSLSDDKKYIFKISQNNIINPKHDYEHKTKEAQLLRGDSPYLNAAIDFYLKSNKCKNGASVLYYNYDYDFVIYKETEGEKVNFDEDTLYNLARFNREKLQDSNRLGIYSNDVHNGTFLKIKGDKDIKIIDMGHISYANIANPGVVGSTTNISNLCGRDLISSLGNLHTLKK